MSGINILIRRNNHYNIRFKEIVLQLKRNVYLGNRHRTKRSLSYIEQKLEDQQFSKEKDVIMTITPPPPLTIIIIIIIIIHTIMYLLVQLRQEISLFE
jgi:hypothetical protein